MGARQGQPRASLRRPLLAPARSQQQEQQPSLVMSLAEGTYRPSALCPLYDSGERFNCAAADPNYAESLWAGASLDVSRFRRAFATSALFFVGDSFTEQHMRATACALRAWNATETFIPAAKCFLNMNFHDIAQVEEDEGRGVARVCYVQAGKGWQDRTTVEAFHAIERSGELSKGSVLIVNEGLWYRVERGNSSAAANLSASMRHGELERARAWGRVDLAALDRRAVRVVWRETSAQHFRTPRATGMWPGRPGLINLHLPKEPCRPLAPTELRGGEQRRRADDVNRALPSAVRVLPLFNASAAGWRSHIERHTPHGRSIRGRDCSHFCEPSPLFEEANAALLELLHEPPRPRARIRHPARRRVRRR